MYSSSVLVELPTVARPTGISVQYSCEPGTWQFCDERRFRVSRVYFLPRYRSQSSPSKSLHEDNRRARATLVGPTLPRTGVSHAHVLDPSDLTRWAKRTKDPPFNHSPPNNSPNGKCLFGDPLDLNTGPPATDLHPNHTIHLQHVDREQGGPRPSACRRLAFWYGPGIRGTAQIPFRPLAAPQDFVDLSPSGVLLLHLIYLADA